MEFNVRCTKHIKGERCFTVGKIYHWQDDTIVSDTGYKYETMVRGTDISKWDLSRCYEFEKVEETKMKNLVYVNFPDGGSNYLYELPENITLSKNAPVYVEVRGCINPVQVTCACDSFKMPDNAVGILLGEIFGARRTELKRVVGLAKATYTMIPLTGRLS